MSITERTNCFALQIDPKRAVPRGPGQAATLAQGTTMSNMGVVSIGLTLSILTVPTAQFINFPKLQTV